ncbi:DUF2934 domain-containing protein [Methylobacter sp.]|uniref:DUF2934 domain-containing protein n=1 Tax=Methylobacter sp. TaxID=2051955 RepID=UPI002FDDF0CF
MSRPANSSDSSTTASFTPINLPDCYTKIAELAFYKAESRGFEPGHEFDDWVEAEREYKEIVAKTIPH